MTASHTARHFVIVLTAVALLCMSPEAVLASPQKAVRKAPVHKRIARSIKRGWHRHKVRRDENRAFKKLIRGNKEIKAIYKAEKKARGTGMLRASKWTNLTLGVVNGGISGALLATGNPLGLLNFGVGVWSNSVGLDSGAQLKSAVRGARRATLKAAADKGVKLDSTLNKAYRRERMAGRIAITRKAADKPTTSLSSMSASLQGSSARKTAISPRRTVIDRAVTPQPSAPANKAGRLGLSSTQLQNLRTYGVEYSGGRDQFRLRTTGKYGKNASQWHDLGQQLLSKDGKFRYHRPRKVNGGRVPAFVEALQ